MESAESENGEFKPNERERDVLSAGCISGDLADELVPIGIPLRLSCHRVSATVVIRVRE